MQKIVPSAHRKKRPLLLLLGSIVLFMLCAILLFAFPPSNSLSLFTLNISLIPLFLILLFFFLFSFTTYLFKNKNHGILLGSFVVTYLIFRLNNITHPFFFILLIALFLTIEILFSLDKKRPPASS